MAAFNLHQNAGEDAANDINLKSKLFRALSFNTAAEFTGRRLEMDDEAAKIMIQCKESSWGDNNFCPTVQDYFNITSNVSQFLSSTRKGGGGLEEAGGNLGTRVEDFIDRYQYLEQKFQFHGTEICPEMGFYENLQLAAKILVMLPFIGPLVLTLIMKENLHSAVAAALVMLVFVTFGVSGRWCFWFCKRREEALQVKEKVISVMLLSIVSQKAALYRITSLLDEGLSTQDDAFSIAIRDLEERLRTERNIILQEMSKCEISARDDTQEELV